MERIELSPFVVQENSDQGYYASQTLAGGRLRQDIKDIGSSIQVVTKEFMDDLAVTGVEGKRTGVGCGAGTGRGSPAGVFIINLSNGKSAA